MQITTQAGMSELSVKECISKPEVSSFLQSALGLNKSLVGIPNKSEASDKVIVTLPSESTLLFASTLLTYLQFLYF